MGLYRGSNFSDPPRGLGYPKLSSSKYHAYCNQRRLGQNQCSHTWTVGFRVEGLIKV